MKWHPTPPERKITGVKLAGDGSWEPVELKDLRPGDVFRSVSGISGELIHPGTHEPDADGVALVTADPIKNVPGCCDVPGQPVGEGYGVPIEFFASMDELRRKGLS